MIVLLGQQRRFKALDFRCHILRVQHVDGKNEDVKGIVNPTRLTKLKRMVDLVRRFEVLNSQIFAILKDSDVERSKKEDEDNECDLGYQVLAKPTSNSGDDDLNTSITQTQTATNNTNNADGISDNISALPLNTSPTVVSGSSAIGLVNATRNTTTTAERLILPYLQYNYRLL
uniref:Uncharacterized protein n=1 Tax=Glossina palpalis gambiensis TaxID=67801 RepID=A0A1B0BU41_9MUSC